MKKTLNFLIVLVLVLSLFSVLCISASAAGNPTVNLSAKESVPAGEEFTVTVNINGAEDVRGIAITAVYDAAQFTLVNGEFLMSGVLQDFDVSTKDGVIAFAAPTEVNGAVLRLTFRMGDNAVQNKYSIRCEVVINDDNGSVDLSADTAIATACKHSFTKKIVDNKYLCSKATCTQKAKYYYACEHCLEKGTATFEDGEKSAHVFDKKNTADKYAKVKETCTSKGTYYYSCVCGEKGDKTFETTEPPSHKYGSALKSDANYHWAECSRCGDQKDKVSHNWNDGEITKHPTTNAEGEKTFTCKECGYKRTESIDKLPSSDVSDTSDTPNTSDTPDVSENGDNSNESAPEGSVPTEESDSETSAPIQTPDTKEADGAPWAVVIILALLAAAGWAVAILLYIKQRK